MRKKSKNVFPAFWHRQSGCPPMSQSSEKIIRSNGSVCASSYPLSSQYNGLLILSHSVYICTWRRRRRRWWWWRDISFQRRPNVRGTCRAEWQSENYLLLYSRYCVHVGGTRQRAEVWLMQLITFCKHGAACDSVRMPSSTTSGDKHPMTFL